MSSVLLTFYLLSDPLQLILSQKHRGAPLPPLFERRFILLNNSRYSSDTCQVCVCGGRGWRHSYVIVFVLYKFHSHITEVEDPYIVLEDKPNLHAQGCYILNQQSSVAGMPATLSDIKHMFG